MNEIVPSNTITVITVLLTGEKAYEMMNENEKWDLSIFQIALTQ